MPDTTVGNRRRDKQQIPRIASEEAERIFAHCEHLLDGSGALCQNLRQAGFSRFLSQLDDKILALAVQPDTWGERTRARVIAEVFSGLRVSPAEDASVEEIAELSNIVMPCLLLELGRRRQHIGIEFPTNPCDSAARFALRAGQSHPIHSISGEQLVRLIAETGEELVGLCYFGDQQSRESIEAQLAHEDRTTHSKTQPCDSSSPSKTKH
ncbi:MAG: hypothetical protein WCA27_05595 [Candidatus Sulfotelmatobacter sp.]